MNDAKTIVLIHGHGVDASIWNHLYEGLSADYQLLKPDFSTVTSHEAVEAYAESVYGMLQTANLDKAVLVGHSMGGYIALAFAEHYPDMVSGLVLFNSTVFADDEERKAKRAKAIEQIKQEGSRAFIGETVPKMVAEANLSTLSHIVEERIEKGSMLPAEALVAGIRAIAARPDRSHVLREANYPVLIIAGKEDNLIPFEKSQSMGGLLTDKGELVVLDGVGHLGMLEKPEKSLRVLREFLVKV